MTAHKSPRPPPLLISDGALQIRSHTCDVLQSWLMAADSVRTFPREYFEDITVYNAAYAHEWDPGGTRMFICGGPLATGLQGSYVSVWR